MVRNKRGESSGVLGVVLWAGIVIAILMVLLVHFSSLGLGFFDISSAPEEAGLVVETLIKVATPLVDLLFLIVAPSGQGNNVQVIAFSIFLLLMLVGTHTLRFAFPKQKFTPFLISLIIGLIAARSLTDTVLKETALGASPIAAASLLLGFIPIYALTRNLDRLGLANFSKMTIYTVSAVVYVFVFWVAFDARILGLVYGIGIMLLGTGEVVMRSLHPEFEKKKNERVGRFLWWAGKVEKTAEQMSEGARRAER